MHKTGKLEIFDYMFISIVNATLLNFILFSQRSVGHTSQHRGSQSRAKLFPWWVGWDKKFVTDVMGKTEMKEGSSLLAKDDLGCSGFEYGSVTESSVDKRGRSATTPKQWRPELLSAKTSASLTKSSDKYVASVEKIDEESSIGCTPTNSTTSSTSSSSSSRTSTCPSSSDSSTSYTGQQWGVLAVLYLATLTSSFAVCLFPPFFPQIVSNSFRVA